MHLTPRTERAGSLAAGRSVTPGSTGRGVEEPLEVMLALETGPLTWSACRGVSDCALVVRAGILYEGESIVVRGVKEVECGFVAGPEVCCVAEELKTELELA